MHYFNIGLPIRYTVITPDGTLQETLLGPNPLEGHEQHLFVPGGCWKASELLYGSEKGGNLSASCDYGLIGEAVAPGFDYSDMTIATAVEMQSAHAKHWERIKHLVKKQ